MSPTLTTIPREIRYKIFAELLSVDNNAYYSDNLNARWPAKMTWDVGNHHSLLNVSKQTRTEARECFHQENNLISLESLYSWDGDYLLREYLPRVVPLEFREHRDFNAALHIDFDSHDGQPSDWATGRGWRSVVDGKTYAVMPGRHLPRLITLINALCYHQKYPNRNQWGNYKFRVPIVKVTFDFNTTSKYYGAPWRANMLADLSKGLQKFHYAYIDNPRGLGGPQPEILVYSREIIVNGLNPEKTKELIEASNLPPITTSQALQQSHKLKEEGDRLAQQKFYTSALPTYLLTIFSITEDPFVDERFHDAFKRPTLEITSMYLRACVGTLVMLRELRLLGEARTLDMKLTSHVWKCLTTDPDSPGYPLEECNELLDAFAAEALRHDCFVMLASAYSKASQLYPRILRFQLLRNKACELSRKDPHEDLTELKNSFFEGVRPLKDAAGST